MDGSMRAATRAGFAAVALVTAFGCGGPQEPGEKGEECYRDADCKLGLVCVPQGSARACSDEVGGLISQVAEPPPPPDAGVPEPPADGG